MGIFDGLKKALYQRNLHKQKQAGQRPQALGFKAAQRIAVFCFLDELGDQLGFIRHYVAELQQQGKQVFLLAFSSEKLEAKAPNPYDFPVLFPRDLDWTGAPKGPYVEEFQQQRFDLLLDLHLSPCPVLEYLATIAPAGLRYGAYRPEVLDCYDVFTEGNGQQSIKALLDNFKHCLAKINQS
jgi:hypothetical protein